MADLISRYPEVSHNFRRDHHYSLWFTLSAESEETFKRSFRRSLPGPVFPGRIPRPAHGKKDQDRCPVPAPPGHKGDPIMDQTDVRILAALEEGLPLLPEPFTEIGKSLGLYR